MLLGIKTVYKGVHLKPGSVTLWLIPVSIKRPNGRSCFIRLLHARFYLNFLQWERNDFLRNFYNVTREYVYSTCVHDIPELIAVKKSTFANQIRDPVDITYSIVMNCTFLRASQLRKSDLFQSL